MSLAVGKVFTLLNTKYVVMSTLEKDGKHYLFVNKRSENKNTEEFFVVLEEEGKLQFVADDALINELLPIFQKNILELAAKITKRE